MCSSRSDAIQSRFRIDQEVAVRRLEWAGAVLTTAEATAFEWLGGSDHPQFKAVSKLVQERMKARPRLTPIYEKYVSFRDTHTHRK